LRGTLIHSGAHAISASLSSSSSISTKDDKHEIRNHSKDNHLLMIFSFSLRSSSSSGPSTFSSKIRSNLFSGHSSFTTYFFWEKWSGGGNRGSTTKRSTFSSIAGIRRASRGHAVSRHGFVFTSIKYTLNSSSIIKSRP